MQKPYLKLYRKFGSYTAWIVDGEWLRKNVDIDFTNFAYHGDKSYVPDKQWWLDVDLGIKEYDFYLANVMTRYWTVKEGGSVDEARITGDKVEKKERSRANPKKYTDIDSEDVDKKDAGKIGSVQVSIVAGDQVRAIDEDYWGGGHDLVYSYVKPKRTIWLDNSQLPKSYRKMLVHEYFERSLMAFGIKYEQAHFRASIVEHYCREYPKMTNTILKYIENHEKDKKGLLKLVDLLGNREEKLLNKNGG